MAATAQSISRQRWSLERDNHGAVAQRTRFGSERANPAPGPGQVCVRVLAAAMNAADWHILRASPFLARFAVGMFRPKFNVLGCDLAGLVDAVGAGVSRFKIGDEVMGEMGSGAFAEAVCAPEKVFHCRHGELDIVAQRGDTCCFVEVRMRSTAVWGDPSQTVSFRKQRKVVKAALHYLFQHDLTNLALRFDVVAVVGQGGGAKVEHIPNAFDAGM
ncbi:MAG: YraN family protein [Myxococcaceae bacterium]